MKKKRIVLIITMLILLPLLSACSNDAQVEIITERFFVQQVSNVLENLDRYTGRTIQLEGVFLSWNEGLPDSDTYYFVLRFLSGCCGGGGTVGFEIYMGDFAPLEDDAWVSVTGVLEIRDGWIPNNPVLVVTEIEELPERGEETVFSS